MKATVVQHNMMAEYLRPLDGEFNIEYSQSIVRVGEDIERWFEVHMSVLAKNEPIGSIASFSALSSYNNDTVQYMKTRNLVFEHIMK